MKNNKNKSTMWVVQNKNTGKFFNKNTRYEYTPLLKNAQVFESRDFARNVKSMNETVKKVSVCGYTPIKLVD